MTLEKELYNVQRGIMTNCQIIAEDYRKQDTGAVDRLNWLVELLGRWTEKLEACRSAKTQAAAQFPAMEVIMDTMKQVLQAQQEQDYVLFADYLELLLYPLASECQNILRTYGEGSLWLPEEEVWEKNRAALPASLAKQLDAAASYPLEETNTGWATVSRTDKKGTYYLHSNSNPSTEGKRLAEQYYEPRTEEYVVVGAGLGYHIIWLLSMGEYFHVKVYETDERMLKSMLTYLDYTPYLKSGQLELICDSDCAGLSKCLNEAGEHTGIFVHEPSLRNISKDNVRGALTDYYRKESGYRKVSGIMEANFYQNRKNCVGNVDMLRPQFEGKDVIIVAAGPSLMKNVELLKTVDKSKTVILAVTTVYRKLLELGIRPDYVIHIDAQGKTWWHLNGIQEDIPLIALSTAYEGCARKYPGRSYIVYQEGYPLAEQAAVQEGFRQYETGGSVSTLALDVAMKNGAGRVILVGLDLAYTDGLAHAKGVSKQKAGTLDGDITTSGYYGGQVQTSRIFLGMIRWFEQYAQKHKDEAAKIINATEGGAHIEGIVKMPLKGVIQ